MSALAHDAAAFDSVADGYDDAFTVTRLGRWLRASVQARLAALFPAGSHVLELGCGTGEDAVWMARRGAHVLATDASPRMVKLTQAKARAAGLADRVETQVLRMEEMEAWEGWEEWEEWEGAGKSGAGKFFDGAFSNFGALNCVADLRGVGGALARLVRPGGRLALVVMGPWCPWEVAWYAAHGQLGATARRWRRGGVLADIGGQPVRVFYPSPSHLGHALAPWFQVTDHQGIGVFLPPSYLSHLVDRWPTAFERLARLEARVSRQWPATSLNDHYLLELVRTEVRV
ncbi:MAG: methyltransferase domain-containing protein [Anaerolineae bacterium]|nr:methyltransferase domain-containing protein [Anaerolineae bacterium]